MNQKEPALLVENFKKIRVVNSKLFFFGKEKAIFFHKIRFEPSKFRTYSDSSDCDIHLVIKFLTVRINQDSK